MPGLAASSLVFENINLKNSYILTHVNKIGFEMHPSKKSVEQAINDSKFEIICMSVLASGALELSSALKYLEGLNSNKLSTVIGCSTKNHIEEYANF